MSESDSGGSEYAEHRMPNQPPGMTLRSRTNVKTNSRSVNRDSTFEVEYTPDVREIRELLRNTGRPWTHDAVMEIAYQRLRDANSYMARESYRATNLRENLEYRQMNMPPKWDEDGVTMLAPYKAE